MFANVVLGLQSDFVLFIFFKAFSPLWFHSVGFSTFLPFWVRKSRRGVWCVRCVNNRAARPGGKHDMASSAYFPGLWCLRNASYWETQCWRLPLYLLKSEIQAWKMFFRLPEMFERFSSDALGRDTVSLTSQGLMGKGVTRENTVVLLLLIWSKSCQICLQKCRCHIRSSTNPGEIKRSPSEWCSVPSFDEQQPRRNTQLYLHFQL